MSIVVKCHKTSWSIATIGIVLVHFVYFCSSLKCSLLHLGQICVLRVWIKDHLEEIEKDSKAALISRKPNRRPSTRHCNDVNCCKSFESSERGVKVHEFKMCLVWVTAGILSSKYHTKNFIVFNKIISFIWFLVSSKYKFDKKDFKREDVHLKFFG